MLTIKAHFSFTGRPKPSGFRFHYFRLRYPSRGVEPRLTKKDFTGGGDPVRALADMRAFMTKRGLLAKGAQFDPSFDEMVESPCGYARVQDAAGGLQVVPVVKRMTFGPMDMVYRIVGGLNDKGVKVEPFIVNDTPRFEHGQIVGGKGEDVSAHLLGIIHPMEEIRRREGGFTMGWQLYVVADSVQVGRKQMSQFLREYAEKRLNYWREVLHYVAPEMRECAFALKLRQG